LDPIKRKIRYVQRLAEKAEPLKEFGVAGPGRGKQTPNKPPKIKTGTTEYWVARIARDRPDVLERMKQGEFESVREAVRAAGWQKKPTVVERTLSLWDQATDEERMAIAVEINWWLLWQNKVVRDAVGDRAVMLSQERGVRPDGGTL
jgi:hypothetical protein